MSPCHYHTLIITRLICDPSVPPLPFFPPSLLLWTRTCSSFVSQLPHFVSTLISAGPVPSIYGFSQVAVLLCCSNYINEDQDVKMTDENQIVHHNKKKQQTADPGESGQLPQQFENVSHLKMCYTWTKSSFILPYCSSSTKNLHDRRWETQKAEVLTDEWGLNSEKEEDLNQPSLDRRGQSLHRIRHTRAHTNTGLQLIMLIINWLVEFF